MLGNLKPQAVDKILMLMGEFRADPRRDKIDLGVGVYRNAQGVTPIMRAVHAAEERLLQTETTKTYTALTGEPGFNAAMAELVLGQGYPADRLASVATPGGTGACRQAFELIRMASPDATIWVSDPTWPNHLSILRHLGMKVALYRYFDTETRGVDFAGMTEDLAAAQAGDVVLLHGCCHNPTGANLNLDQWERIADLLQRTGATPMIDIAYQGFGDGLEEDAAGVRLLAQRLPEMLIAASCSKNFGIYRERTGVLMALSDPAHREVTQGNLNYLNRQNYSFPPDHGARIVMTILNDPALRADWQAELEEVRLGMLALRQQLAEELRRLSGSDRFGFIAQHRGMFSRLGATPEQVEKMKKDHAIYMVGDSRINVAGLNESTVPVLARAMIEAGL
ncbi:aromatic-amino-acid transaminase [Albidovulum inexpectatum]|uniref:Aromatic-amino-acid transaminase n=1 Tax=Albidovulum inexpectatum TaxID=196587 RepID=A0A2S5JLV1_9RHOB|nr:amino acid aminotransferase [Albidovulum inexpectatum]PPB82378.1 aromatic-amino-acid transaminase [Albidovulum inexpectatum]